MTTPKPSPELAERLARWDELSRWERSEIGRALRRDGWSYGEIREVIDVPKGTLAGWCRDIRLTHDQAAAIRRRTGSVNGVPRNMQWRRREQIERIGAEARAEVPHLIHDPLWLAGTVMYWAEGSKRDRTLAFANSDPRACRFFIDWTRNYHSSRAVFVVKLNLHAGNDERQAKRFWLAQLPLDSTTRFYKTFIKPEGTGHRKNHLEMGVAQVRVRRSADSHHRTMGWIDGVGHQFGLAGVGPLLFSRPGR